MVTPPIISAGVIVPVEAGGVFTYPLTVILSVFPTPKKLGGSVFVPMKGERHVRVVQ